MSECQKIIDRLSREKYIVYGAGGHADKFVKAMEKKGIAHNFLGYAISSGKIQKNNCKYIEEVDREHLVVVAAHDKNSSEMEQNLIRLGFENYMLIYPYMTELCFGSPYKTDVFVEIDEFLKTCRYGNYLAIYYLAVACADGKNDFGDKLYLRVMGLSSEEKTAANRWEAMIKRTWNYRNKQEIEDFPVKLNVQQKYILDGFHRMALAKYFGIDKLRADLFSTELDDYNSMTFQNMWLDEDLNHYFSEDEKKQIIRVRKEIFGQVE